MQRIFILTSLLLASTGAFAAPAKPDFNRDVRPIITENCVACHRADGGGKSGPNLTDKNWMLGGGIKNIYHTLENGGRDGKGMISWKAILKPREMQLVASYVLSMEGSNPKDAKVAEGEIWTEKDEKLKMK